MIPIQYFVASDGARLAFRELGAGRTLILIHGFFSTATVNWMRYGHAPRLAELGYRVVMPDLRGHGDSASPHEAEAYPPDILTDDALRLVQHLGIGDYDLGGYSLGARTTVRSLTRGALPARAIVAGMGLEGIVKTGGRGAHFRHILTHLGSFSRGSAEWMAEAFLRTVGGDPIAMLHVLDSFVDTPSAALGDIRIPTLVVSGVDDRDNGSADALASALPVGVHREIPGNHMSAVTKPELGSVIAEFLGSPHQRPDSP